MLTNANNLNNSQKILDELLKYLKISANKLSTEIGLSANTAIYHVKNGRNGISSDLANKIIERYPEINYSWLLTGEGSMKKNAEVGKMHAIDEEQANYKFEDDDVYALRQDIKAVNENLIKLSEGVTVNFERIGGALFEGLKSQQKILKFIEQIDADRINKATGKLDEFLESR